MTKDTKSDHHSPGEPNWLERNVNVIIVALVIACVATLVAQLVFGLGYDDHHPAHFPQEEWFGFQAAFGFAAFVGAVFLGQALRLIVRRSENYYDPD
jgi:hypothetical protein